MFSKCYYVRGEEFLPYFLQKYLVIAKSFATPLNAMLEVESNCGSKQIYDCGKLILVG